MIKAIKTLMVLPLVLAIFLLICSFINTDWEVSHEVEINASPSQVWSLLSDLEGYSDWNRYSPNVKGTFSVGEVVWVEAHLDNEVRHVQNYIISIIPEQELCWESADWFGRLANGRRCRWLTATALGGTHLVHHEIMMGPLAWLIEKVYRERIERGLALVDNSLAEAAEAL